MYRNKDGVHIGSMGYGDLIYRYAAHARHVRSNSFRLKLLCNDGMRDRYQEHIDNLIYICGKLLHSNLWKYSVELILDCDISNKYINRNRLTKYDLKLKSFDNEFSWHTTQQSIPTDYITYQPFNKGSTKIWQDIKNEERIIDELTKYKKVIIVSYDTPVDELNDIMLGSIAHVGYLGGTTCIANAYGVPTFSITQNPAQAYVHTGKIGYMHLLEKDFSIDTLIQNEYIIREHNRIDYEKFSD